MQDIRWRNVWAEIGPAAVDMRQVLVAVSWEGVVFTCNQMVGSDSDIPAALDHAVEGIDAMMYDRGFLPYEIRSK